MPEFCAALLPCVYILEYERKKDYKQKQKSITHTLAGVAITVTRPKAVGYTFLAEQFCGPRLYCQMFDNMCHKHLVCNYYYNYET